MVPCSLAHSLAGCWPQCLAASPASEGSTGQKPHRPRQCQLFIHVWGRKGSKPVSVSMALGHKRGTNPPAALQLRAAACLESMTRPDPDVSVLWPICSQCHNTHLVKVNGGEAKQKKKTPAVANIWISTLDAHSSWAQYGLWMHICGISQ